MVQIQTETFELLKWTNLTLLCKPGSFQSVLHIPLQSLIILIIISVQTIRIYHPQKCSPRAVQDLLYKSNSYVVTFLNMQSGRQSANF